MAASKIETQSLLLLFLPFEIVRPLIAYLISYLLADNFTEEEEEACAWAGKSEMREEFIKFLAQR